VVHNPVDSVFFSRPSHQTQPKHAKGPIDKFITVAIAKDLSEPRKNIEFVIRSLEEASRVSGADISLFLIGQNGGNFSSSTVRLVWLGELTAAEIFKQVSAADLLLSGSLAESAGMTVVECAAMGIPSLALENGGTASQIRNGVSGILARDFDSFTTGVLDLISKPSDLWSLGAAARDIAELHRPDVVARRYLDVYESIA
jgi:glycosyltransferase involved in cell wall biosynthesis